MQVRNDYVMTSYKAEYEAMQKKYWAEREKVRLLLAALTPSLDTKATYMGEFTVPFPDHDEDGNEVMRHINVPWTTIKEIMAAIRKHAAATESE